MMHNQKPEIYLADTAGFCMGVSLALQKLDKALAENVKDRICTLGPIIHNPQVLEQYKEKGVVFLEEAGQARAGDRVIIRAHGIPVEKERELNHLGAIVIDATCPKVKKAQQAIHKMSSSNHLLLFGEPDHPEVEGLLSYAQGSWDIIESEAHLDSLQVWPEKRYMLTAQTTQDRTQFESMREILSAHLGPNLQIADTICEATRNRQLEAIHIAREVDFMIVIGGKISGNTRRLVQVIEDQNVPTQHIETEQELEKRKLSEYSRIGITAGASTPGDIIRQVVQSIEQ